MPGNVLALFNAKMIEKNAKPECDFMSFNVGDTINVGVKIQEGVNTRIQQFQGLCIAKRSRGIATGFTVRKFATGNESVERQFLIYLSSIEYINIVKRGKVRRAKLYYLRGRSSKKSRIKEKFEKK